MIHVCAQVVPVSLLLVHASLSGPQLQLTTLLRAGRVECADL
jgi:hypothetical protein